MPVLVYHLFIHYDGRKTGFIIGASKFTAGNNRDSHGREIVRAHLDVLHRRPFVGRGLITINTDGCGKIRGIGEWPDAHESSRLDATERPDAINQALLKSPGPRRVVS